MILREHPAGHGPSSCLKGDGLLIYHEPELERVCRVFHELNFRMAGYGCAISFRVRMILESRL